MPSVSAGASGLVPYGRRLRDLASERPGAPAITFAFVDRTQRTLTFGQLDVAAIRAAHLLSGHGVSSSTLVVVVLPNGPAHVIATHAAWKLGASVLPYNPRAPRPEREQVLQVASTFRPVVTVGAWTDGIPPDVTALEVEAAPAEAVATQLPDLTPVPGAVIASGGTTGTPKLTITEVPAALRVRDGQPDLSQAQLGLRPGLVHLITTPLYHTSGFNWTHLEMLVGNHVVVAERFDGGLWLDLVERHRVSHAIVVPSIMQRLVSRSDIAERDLSSLEFLCHGGSVCPDWVKRRWLELVPPRGVIEAFGGTEPIGGTSIDGEEWLRHPGSVGRPTRCDLRILDPDGRDLPPEQVGEIFMRPLGAISAPFRYAGAPYHATAPGGFVSVGDFGWVDAEGYLYIADRRVDMIITGGANVYPAEVESCLSEHPLVADAAVIGLSDPRWGRRVHAVVLPRDPGLPPGAADLERHCRERLAPYKVPKTYEVVSALPRSEAGKLARRALVEAREPANPDDR